MAFQTTWYFSDLPKEAIEIIEKDLENDFIISDNHWLNGFLLHYVERANRENFLYDLSHLDSSSIKFKINDEGESYNKPIAWHCDSKPVDDDNNICKLSFIIQLSDVDDYEGGNVQFLDEGGGKYYMPRQRGCIGVFDSRTQHRVQKVTKRRRKSLIGFCLGPQWT